MKLNQNTRARLDQDERLRLIVVISKEKESILKNTQEEIKRSKSQTKLPNNSKKITEKDKKLKLLAKNHKQK